MSQAATAVTREQPAVKKSIAVGLWAVFLSYFLAQFFLYALNIARPRMAGDLNGMTLFAWSISIPGLASAVSTLIFGKLSDMYGRRIILLVSMAFFGVGSILSALAPTFVIVIAAGAVSALGSGALMPLCFSVLGDLFPPAERARWSGLMAIPAGIAAMLAPTLGGLITDQLNWRVLFWLAVPFALICAALVARGVPDLAQKGAHKIDYLGSVILIIASAATILGFSWAGTTYPWGSPQIIGLFIFALAAWAAFLWVESKAAEPMLDPQVLTNRTFITAALAGFMSFFGLIGIMAYYPLFVQNVQGANATVSGQALTPFSVLMAFMGVPAGLLLAKTKRYKWMYVVGYALLTAMMFVMWTFNKNTPLALSILVTALAGLGLGTIPTINTLVAQFAVPRRLLGVAVGAIYFFVMMGMAIAPAILGGVQNAVQASTGSLEAALKVVFLVGAVTMAVSFLMIITIPEINIDVEAQDKKK
ncbi:MAG: MFS transporter [Anaerolineae bacterium]|nr:MFS transporter [Anaerolineae bacterium]